ncbi:hypothetical protein CEN47_06280 [Fischerella thermalis CCMEE 5319]|nr:hypothetical protein CEN47_06280 [Fischerella thermalis CCMEE 5319]
MAHLLHIDSSPRGERSHSRRLTREFVEAWKQAHPDGITDITFVHVENDELGGTSLAQSIAAARIQVAQLLGR